MCSLLSIGYFPFTMNRNAVIVGEGVASGLDHE